MRVPYQWLGQFIANFKYLLATLIIIIFIIIIGRVLPFPHYLISIENCCLKTITIKILLFFTHIFSLFINFFRLLFIMPKVRRSRKPPPDGWELIEPTLEELEQKMREGRYETKVLIVKVLFHHQCVPFRPIKIQIL